MHPATIRSEPRPSGLQQVTVQAGGVALACDLAVPVAARAIIVFAHGSSALSPRAGSVARSFGAAGFATMLFDLLTRDEEAFDLAMLADRLVDAVAWVERQDALARLPIGLFAASMGSAAALIAATRVRIGAVVSRSGRPDLAVEALPHVHSPTLLVVGGADVEVLELNRRALQRMTGPAAMHIVANAGHLFEEPGALRAVTTAATAWYRKHLIAL
jgi:dienelactone hydrolase